MPSRVILNLDELFGALKLLSEEQQQSKQQSIKVLGVTSREKRGKIGSLEVYPGSEAARALNPHSFGKSAMYPHANSNFLQSDANSSHGSPTRVADFEVLTPSKTLERLRPIPAPRTRTRATITPLPTVDEAAVDTSQDSYEPIQIKHPVSTPKKGASEKAAEMMDKAVFYDATGQEDEALSAYKKTLAIHRSEITRISKHLQQVQDKHPASVASISGRLQEDWLRVGFNVAQIRMRMAHLYERLGDYKRAIACVKEAIEVYNKQEYLSQVRKKNTDILSKSFNEAKLLIEQLMVAKGSFEDRKRLQEEVFLLRQELAACQDAKKREDIYAEMERKALCALKLESKILGPEHPLVGDTTSLLGAMALEHQEREIGIEYLINGLEITKKALGVKHPRTGQKLLQLGRIYVSTDEDLGLQYLKQAADVYNESGNYQRLVGSILNDIAVLRIQRREFAEAVDMLMDALKAYEAEVAIQDDTNIYADKVQIWRNIGEAYQLDRQMDRAIESLIKALDMQRDGRRAYDAACNKADAEETAEVPSLTLVDDESIAETLRRLGKAYSITSKYEHALMVYKEALLIHQIAVKRVMVSGRTSPELPAKQDQMAHTLFCLAEVYDAKGQNSDAMRLYSESLQLRLFSDAHRPNARTNMVHCAMCLFGIGGIHMKNLEWPEAIGVLKDAVTYCTAHGVPEDHQIFIMIKQRVDIANQNALLKAVIDVNKNRDRDGPPSSTSSLSSDCSARERSLSRDLMLAECEAPTTHEPETPNAKVSDVKRPGLEKAQSISLLTPSPQTVKRIVDGAFVQTLHSTANGRANLSTVNTPPQKLYNNVKGMMNASSTTVSNNGDREGPLTPTTSQSFDESEASEADVENLEKIADTQIQQGDLESAVVTLSQIMALRKIILKRMKNTGQKSYAEKSVTAKTLTKFGKVLVMQGDTNNAKRAYNDALKLYRKSGEQSDAAAVQELTNSLHALQK